MLKHTPGPWVVDLDFEGEGIHGINSEGRDWKAVATVTANSEGVEAVSIEEAEANARLIAASPDLLAACQALPVDCAFEDAADFKDNAAALRKAMELARKAIDKATGESED